MVEVTELNEHCGIEAAMSLAYRARPLRRHCGEGKQSFDEIHVLMPELITEGDKKLLASSKLVTYRHLKTEYPIDTYLTRIDKQYGINFKDIVKRGLDYN